MRLGSSSSRPRARPVAAMGGVPDHLASLTRRDMQCRPETPANETREAQRADLGDRRASTDICRDSRIVVNERTRFAVEDQSPKADRSGPSTAHCRRVGRASDRWRWRCPSNRFGAVGDEDHRPALESHVRLRGHGAADRGHAGVLRLRRGLTTGGADASRVSRPRGGVAHRDTYRAGAPWGRRNTDLPARRTADLPRQPTTGRPPFQGGELPACHELSPAHSTASRPVYREATRPRGASGFEAAPTLGGRGSGTSLAAPLRNRCTA